MQHLKDGSRSSTGAASGIGFALAERAADRGMTVVLCDIESGPAGSSGRTARSEVSRRPPGVDVSKKQKLRPRGARLRLSSGRSPALQQRRRPQPRTSNLGTYRGRLAVAIFGERYGVVHGVRAFVPRMLASGEEGHIVNTASMAGLVDRRHGHRRVRRLETRRPFAE